MDLTREQIDAMARECVPELERGIERLRPLVEASRGSIFFEGFAHDLGRHERSLAAIRRDHM